MAAASLRCTSSSVINTLPRPILCVGHSAILSSSALVGGATRRCHFSMFVQGPAPSLRSPRPAACARPALRWPSLAPFSTSTSSTSPSSQTPSKQPGREKECWTCHLPLHRRERYFCVNCKVIQPVEEKGNYFEALGLPVSFDIDNAQLDAKFRELQRKLHPDRFFRKSQREQLISDEHAKQVNQAYLVLKEPNSRALYMLELAGHKMQEDARLTDLEFLADILQIREKLTEHPSPEEVKRIRDQNDAELRRLYAQYLEKISDELHAQFFDHTAGQTSAAAGVDAHTNATGARAAAAALRK